MMYTAEVSIFHKEVSNMHNFIEGLMEFHFLQNALVSAVVIGAVAGILGCFIILRGMSLMGGRYLSRGITGCSVVVYFRH